MYDVSSIVQISPEELDFIHNVDYIAEKHSSNHDFYYHPLIRDFTAVYDKLFGEDVEFGEYETTHTTIENVHKAITYPEDGEGQKYMKKCKIGDLFMIYVPVAFLYGLAYAVTRTFPDVFPPEKRDLE